jgi:hypothetical protein
MVTLRFAVSAILAAAAAAGCFTYFVTPSPAQVDADQRLPPTAPNLRGPDTTASIRVDQRPSADEPSADEKAAAAYQKAAEAILRRAPNVRASAGGDEPPITGPIPLPKRRPITRP